ATAVALGILAFAANAEEKPACPTGEAGDWMWQASGSDIQLKNLDFPIGWETSGGDVSTHGFALAINLDGGDKEKIRVARFELPPLDFSFVRDPDTENTRTYQVFSPFPMSEEAIAGKHIFVAMKFTMAGLTVVDEAPKLLFQTRVETYEGKGNKVEGSWASWDHPIDWSFTSHEDFRLAFSTPYFTPYGQAPQWSNVAISKPIDLTVLTPIIENLRVKMLEQSQIFNMCQPHYGFMRFE
ncbi:MAG: hypothetical protein WA989_07625, partial [Henriciella sp.]|uniref:hypothetical protein n=1 Tax=Henriciella sp. TaxID=1968823 RepID=UPI003C73A80F